MQVRTASPAPVRRTAELLHRLVPHAAFTEVAGAGHMAPVLDPTALAPLLFPGHEREPLALAA